MSIVSRRSQTTQAVTAIPSKFAPASSPTQPASLASAVELQQWGREVARCLPLSCCRILVDAVTATLRGDAPYIPPSAEDAPVAEQLSQTSGAPLLQSEPAGYVLAYQLAPYGAAVVAAFLGDYLLGRAIPPLVPTSIPLQPVPPRYTHHGRQGHMASPAPAEGGQNGWRW